MKILQVAPYFYPAWSYGGIPRVVYELSRELARRGHEVAMYTTDVFDRDSRCPDSGRTTSIDGVRTTYFKNLSNSLAYHLQLFLPVGMRSAVESSISDFDIIHLHGHRNLLNNIVSHYAQRAGKRYLLSGHGTVLRIERRVLLKTFFDRIFGDRVLRGAARLVAVSNHEVRQYESMGIGKDKVSVIYNGIDVDAFRVLPAPGSFKARYGLRGRNMVLYLGKITPRKGIDFLVRAFSLLKDRDAHLVIAGNDMGYRRVIERIIRQNGLADRVLFTGLLTGPDKLAAYHDADVLVYPAIHEIFGLVPFEALLCGTPVIVTDDCGCGEIIEQQKIGYLVKYNDTEGLRRALLTALTDRGSAKALAHRGKTFVESQLDWELVVERYLTLYEELAREDLLR